MSNVIDITERLKNNKQVEEITKFDWLIELIQAGEITDIIGVLTDKDGNRYAISSDYDITKGQFRDALQCELDKVTTIEELEN